ncbi:MAG: pyruvate formate-lyase-activating protein [Holophaga sp.]|nr:pyruvate formate-lyase-activating protein [Holophaga sp.]
MDEAARGEGGTPCGASLPCPPRTARIHSLESMGTVDGPGLRFVVFFQGCAYRCLYCHNPDTWAPSGGREITLDDLLGEIRGLAGFIKKRGGVTASGGEPLLQAPFVAEFFRRLRREGFHTALDTTGMVATPEALKVLDHTSLVLMDLKGMGDTLHRRMTGRSEAASMAFADEVRRRNLPVRFRVVLVPGYTDTEENLRRIADFTAGFPAAEPLELLPFHKMGEYKWEALQQPYFLHGVSEPTEAEIARARERLRQG